MNKVRFDLIGAFWLGFSLSTFANINFMDWRLYAISIPTFIFFVINNNLNKQ